jgi:hypothetical protein
VRTGYAQDAVLVMAADGDDRAPGGVVTTALCGSWEHSGPCPHPHHTSATRDGDELHVRVLFAAEPDLAESVRRHIVEALARGGSDEDAEHPASWRLSRTTPGELTPAEVALAARLAGS